MLPNRFRAAFAALSELLRQGRRWRYPRLFVRGRFLFPSDDDALDACVVLEDLRAGEGGDGEGGDRSGLMDADFDGEEAAVLEEGGRVCHEAAVEVEAVLAAGKRGVGLFEPDFGREGGDVAVRDVGRVGEDGVVALARERREQVAGVEGDAVRDFERGGVFLGDRARGRADVDGVCLRLGQEMEDGKTDGACTCADVGETGRVAARAQALDGGLYEDFRVGARHEGVRRDTEGEPHEFFFPDDVGDGDALDALLDGLAVARELRWLERLVEVDVEVDAFAAEDVAEEDFGVKVRRLDVLLLEILFGPFEDAADGPEFLHVSPPASAAVPDLR